MRHAEVAAKYSDPNLGSWENRPGKPQLWPSRISGCIFSRPKDVKLFEHSLATKNAITCIRKDFVGTMVMHLDGSPKRRQMIKNGNQLCPDAAPQLRHTIENSTAAFLALSQSQVYGNTRGADSAKQAACVPSAINDD